MKKTKTAIKIKRYDGQSDKTASKYKKKQREKRKVCVSAILYKDSIIIFIIVCHSASG